MPKKQTKTNAEKRPVSERALVGRVRRKLAHENDMLTIARPGSRLEANCGRYIIVDEHNAVKAWGGGDALVLWARELGVMHSDERLVAS